VEPAAGHVQLVGYLTVPENAAGIVVFAYGSGSSRHSPRNRYVARVLNGAGLGTLLFDLLTPAEELDRANVFDIGLLARRLAGVTGWLRTQPAAVGTAAMVSRGGRPDLARPRLAAVTAPTLFIVGGRDEVVLDLNRRAQAGLRCENRLAIAPGAIHLFEEPGTLDARRRAGPGLVPQPPDPQPQPCALSRGHTPAPSSEHDHRFLAAIGLPDANAALGLVDYTGTETLFSSAVGYKALACLRVGKGTCSTTVSEEGKNELSCPSFHRTRYGGLPSLPRTPMITPRRSGLPT